ncbi:Uncharacterised protein [uncultured archaeon]|nr:Uncharacterised protein [uncultured archaeon]
MPITAEEARTAFGKIMAAHPAPIRMVLFKDQHEHITSTGESVPAPAYYTAGTIYAVLDNLTTVDIMTFVLAHEVGHQYFDPGNIVVSYIASYLYLKKSNKLDNRLAFRRMSGIQNGYSDAVVNCVTMYDTAYDKQFGKGALEKVMVEAYSLTSSYIDGVKIDPTNALRLKFINAFMAMWYVRNHEPEVYRSVREKVNKDPTLARIVELVEKLAVERDLAVRDVQAYYDIAVELFEKFDQVGVIDFGGVEKL